ncbi:MAG: class I SAM-dependent methyltransferase, partial [Burkholderiales bacterium]
LATEGTELPPVSRILDFGCGCGRVIRYLSHVFPDREFVGTDIDAEAIRWSRNYLAHLGTFQVNGTWPPLDHPDESFDLVIANSVFTHLPEDMQFAWLKELRRVTRNGGYLLLTVHGPDVYETFDSARRAAENRNWESIRPKIWSRLREFANAVGQRLHLTHSIDRDARQFKRRGFFYWRMGVETAGLPDFYQTSFHAEHYIRDRWSPFFEIRRIVSKGMAHNQDLVLCRRRD